jgi:chromosome segregation ATPase
MVSSPEPSAGSWHHQEMVDWGRARRLAQWELVGMRRRLVAAEAALTEAQVLLARADEQVETVLERLAVDGRELAAAEAEQELARQSHTQAATAVAALRQQVTELVDHISRLPPPPPGQPQPSAQSPGKTGTGLACR